jgi:beta-aspartyl-dipeptidase (metallo-type)
MLALLLDADVFAPEPLGRRHLLVAGEKVVWMGSSPPALPPALEAEIIDLGGLRLVPGFIDCHVHVTGGGGEGGPQSSVPPIPLSQFTRGGTTTVVGLLGTDDLTRSPASLVARTRALTAEGLSAYCWTGGYHVPPVTLTGSVRGDIAFIEPVIGIGEIAISDHRSSQPTREEILRLAGEARTAGMLAGKAGILHLHVGGGARGLEFIRSALDLTELPPSVFHPTHVNRRRSVFAEALELAARGVAIDVTAYPIGTGGDEAIPAAGAIAEFLGAGLPPDRITVSTDAGGSLPVFDSGGRFLRMGIGRPEALAATLAELLRQGHALGDVLPPFTANPAALLRLHAKGRIATGTDADLVVLDEEGVIRDVMARGRWHVRERRILVRGMFEEASGD